MAKSLRSKWKRKCRAKKRESYGLKELDRLNKILRNSSIKNAIKDDVKEMVNITTPIIRQQADPLLDTNNVMEIDETADTTTDIKKLQYKNGQYPIWLHPRKYRIKKKSNRRKMSNKLKRTKRQKKNNKSH